MRVLKRLSALATALFLAAVPAAAAPLEAYGKLPTIEAVAISPGGVSIAMVVTNGEDRLIVLQEVGTGRIFYRANSGEAKVRAIRWAGDGHLLVVTTVTASPMDVITSQREWMMAFSLDVASKKMTPLMREVPEAMNTIAELPAVREVDGRPTAFVQGIQFVGGQGRLSLFRIDLSQGAKSRLFETGMSDTRDWVVGPDGQPAAQWLYDQKSGRWSVKLRNGSGWREALGGTALLDPPSIIGLGRDGKSVLYTTRDETERRVWQEVRLDNAPAGPPIPVSDTQGPIFDPQDGRLIGQVSLVGDVGAYTFFDDGDARVWRAVVAAYPGSFVNLASWSADHRKIVVKVDSPEEGPAYAFVDLATRKATWLGAEYQGVRTEDVAPQKPVAFKARDGMALTGYLTTPRGKTPKALPLIVFPHGGPASRDQPGFDWWAQGMASRGYAVLQVNFRGSEGFGPAHLEAGYGQWGRKMQTDLSDGVKHLAEQGVIDPKRVCIVGASYGGYAALAGAALDPGVYRCAASYGGVSDLPRMVAWSKNKQGRAAFRYWTRFMGAESSLPEVSPAVQAGRVAIPVLLIHGRDDSVVPLEQSRVMADALQKAGRPVELLVLKGEDHWLSRGDTRLQTLTATMAFVEKHNPPD